MATRSRVHQPEVFRRSPQEQRTEQSDSSMDAFFMRSSSRLPLDPGTVPQLQRLAGNRAVASDGVDVSGVHRAADSRSRTLGRQPTGLYPISTSARPARWMLKR
jgi:hypothetical protein